MEYYSLTHNGIVQPYTVDEFGEKPAEWVERLYTFLSVNRKVQDINAKLAAKRR